MIMPPCAQCHLLIDSLNSTLLKLISVYYNFIVLQHKLVCLLRQKHFTNRDVFIKAFLTVKKIFLQCITYAPKTV